MITAALFIGIAVVLLMGGALVAGQSQLRELARRKLEQEVDTFLSEAEATDDAHANGQIGDCDVAIYAGHDLIVTTVTLPEAILGYDELLARFGDGGLVQALDHPSYTVSAKTVTIVLTREANIADTLGTLQRRLAILPQIVALRWHTPGILCAKIPKVHDAYEVDKIIEQLCRTFPTAPETRQAVEAACTRYTGAHYRAKAEGWLAAAVA